MKLELKLQIDTEEENVYEKLSGGLSRAEVLDRYYADHEVAEEDREEEEPVELALVHYAIATFWNRSVSVSLVDELHIVTIPSLAVQ